MRSYMICRRAWSVALLVGLLPALAPSALPPAVARPADPKGEVKRQGQPMAVVVAQRDYPRAGEKLAAASAAAVRLAAQLGTAGYRVELIIDKEAAAEASRGLKAHTAATVRVIGAATALKEALGEWMTAAAAARAPLALLVLCGHGVERAGEPYFLTVGDDPATGGVSVAALRRAAGACAPAGLYVAMVCDMCRTPRPAPDPPAGLTIIGTDGKPVAALAGGPARPDSPPDRSGDFGWLETRERTFRVTSTPAAGVLVPTVLYSTRSGAAAVATDPLVHHLAEALRDQKALGDFLALMAGDRSKRDELTLYDWVHFAVARLQATNLTQAHELVVGGVPLSQPVARRQRGAWAGPVRETAIDLLAGRPARDMGELSVSHHPRLGMVISRPTDDIAAPWAGFPVAPPDGVDPSDKFLVLDIVPGFPSAKPGAGRLTFSVNPVHRAAANKHTNLFHGNRDLNTPPLSVLVGVPGRITVPLLAIPDTAGRPLSLNGLGLATTNNLDATWPKTASVTVIGMTVESKREAVPVKDIELVPIETGDLLPGAWAGGESFPGSPVLRLVTSDPNKDAAARYRLVPEPGGVGMSRCGGELVPPRYAPPGYDLQLDAWSTVGTADVVVDLLHRDPKTGAVTPYADRRTVTVRARGQPPAKVVLDSHGFVNYFRISTTSPHVRIKSIRLVPPM